MSSPKSTTRNAQDAFKKPKTVQELEGSFLRQSINSNKSGKKIPTRKGQTPKKKIEPYRKEKPVVA